MGEKSFLPTSTPRWHHAEGAFLGGLPCIGIIEIPIHERSERGFADRVRSVPYGKVTARAMHDGRFDAEQTQVDLQNMP
ncbi:hypothetical protein NLO93_28490, partial [Pseudomonas savastanoi]|uniref:hypothetical protein n=1 Tax=Pseudomonas savastanoi TaxID=29438 RepID=UPI00210C2F17